MASTKKQEKPSVVPEQAVPAPGDQALNSPPGGSDPSGADAAAGGVAVTVPGAEPVANTVQEAGGPAGELPIELPPVGTSAEGAAGRRHSRAGRTHLERAGRGEHGSG
ncbi:MAG: hypothetical protein OXF59_01755 [Pseudomonas sp.]|nr:hypothetical protein [Pseudomonas sp.]